MKYFLLLIFTIAFFFIIIFIFKPNIFSFTFLEPTKYILDSEVSILTPIYRDLTNDPVHGKLVAKIISDKSYKDMKIYGCPITNGVVVDVGEGKRRYLDCKENFLKESIINENNEFSLSLLSGMYFIDLAEKSNESINTLPFRVNIHKGKQADLTIHIN